MKTTFSLRFSKLFFIPVLAAALGFGACRTTPQPKSDPTPPSSQSEPSTPPKGTWADEASTLPPGFPPAPVATTPVIRF